MAAYSLADLLGSTERLQPKPSTRARARVRSARSQNRAAAWAYDLEQWKCYRLAMAKTESERAVIEADYVARVAAGPDFATYRAGSDFAPAHRNQLTQADKLAALRAYDEVRAWLYRNARKAHGQGISLMYRKVLEVLLSMGVRWGTVFPSIASIAAAVNCNPRTVTNALQWLRTWGFLDWRRRLKRVPSRLGPITRQDSNSYRLLLRGLAAIGAAVFSRRDGNYCQPSSQSPPVPSSSPLLIPFDPTI